MLSTRLRQSTADSHKAVERSRGVKALMGVSSASNTESKLGRVDYVRWLVMLALVYAALEDALQHAAAAADIDALRPLLSDASLLPTLARAESLLDDVATHARSLATDDGIDLDDVGQQQQLWLSDAQSQLQQELAAILASRCAHAATYTAILTPPQLTAASNYTRRLIALTQRSQLHPARLLAHVYVRYLGDLSGGQHLARRVHSQWPISHSSQAPSTVIGSAGFRSYAFAQQQWSGNGAASTDEERLKRKLQIEVALKDQIRLALDQAVASADATQDALTRVICDEADVAFLLSAGLFDALIETDDEAGSVSSNTSTSEVNDVEEKHTQLLGAAPHTSRFDDDAALLTIMKHQQAKRDTNTPIKRPTPSSRPASSSSSLSTSSATSSSTSGDADDEREATPLHLGMGLGHAGAHAHATATTSAALSLAEYALFRHRLQRRSGSSRASSFALDSKEKDEGKDGERKNDVGFKSLSVRAGPAGGSGAGSKAVIRALLATSALLAILLALTLVLRSSAGVSSGVGSPNDALKPAALGLDLGGAARIEVGDGEVGEGRAAPAEVAILA